VRYAPTGEYVAVGRSDGRVDVYTGSGYTLFAKLKGHEGAVRALDWSCQGDIVRSNALDDVMEVCFVCVFVYWFYVCMYV
jgi:hypothetical protein